MACPFHSTFMSIRAAATAAKTTTTTATVAADDTAAATAVVVATKNGRVTERFVAHLGRGLALLSDVCGLPRVLSAVVVGYVAHDPVELSRQDRAWDPDAPPGCREYEPWMCRLVVTAPFATLHERVVELQHATVSLHTYIDNLRPHLLTRTFFGCSFDYPFAADQPVLGHDREPAAVIDARQFLSLWHALVLDGSPSPISGDVARAFLEPAAHDDGPAANAVAASASGSGSGSAGAAVVAAMTAPVWWQHKALSMVGSFANTHDALLMHRQVRDLALRLVALVTACAMESDTEYCRQRRVRRALQAAGVALRDLPPAPVLEPLPDVNDRCRIRLWASPAAALGLLDADAHGNTDAAAPARLALDDIERVQFGIQFGPNALLCTAIQLYTPTPDPDPPSSYW